MLIDRKSVQVLHDVVQHSAGTPHGQMVGLTPNQFDTALTILAALLRGAAVQLSDRDPGAPPAVPEFEAALFTLFRAADEGILPEAVYADLARLRIALAVATQDPLAGPCARPRF